MPTMIVFGAGGQVGRELALAARPPDWRIVALSRAEADIASADAVDQALRRHAPRVAVNAAAYTAVDRAESEPDLARAGNAVGPAVLARACAAAGIPLIHISTDYVFDGRKSGPYAEDDPINPLGVYGATKAAGEQAVRAALPAHVILRTSWVFGRYGANFVRTMLRLGQERDRLRIVADQHGGPTAAHDIAAAIMIVARRLVETPEAPYGTYHYAGAPATTWYGFAEAIFAEARRHGVMSPTIEPIATIDYPTPARRPANSVLDCAKIAAAFGLRPPDWRASLRAVVASLVGGARPLAAPTETRTLT